MPNVLVVPPAPSGSHLIPPLSKFYVRRDPTPCSPVVSPDSPDRRYLSRDHRPPVRLGFITTSFSSSFHSFLSRIHAYAEPQSYKEACNEPN